MKIYFKTFGCRVNQIETQSVSEKFSLAGYARTENAGEADFIFINTCCVTEKADRDVLNFIKKSSALNPAARLLVTGCYSTLFPEAVLRLRKDALLFPNPEKEKIVSIISGKEFGPDFFKVTGFEGKTRAFVKIQDGCDLKCSYCIVPFGRKEIKSKDSRELLEEIRLLLRNGFKEIILSGTRLGYYKCPEKGWGLKELLAELLALPGEFRIRLSSLEPMEINPALLSVLAGAGDKFCDHFHLPLQSGSDAVLKAMKRPYNGAFFSERVEMIRNLFPRAGIFSDVIAGFPLETERDFEDTLLFIEKNALSGLHAFTYSAREGAEAGKYPGKPQAVKAARSKKLRELDLKLRSRFSVSLTGSRLKVITLKRKGDFTLGLSSNFQNVLLEGSPGVNLLGEARIKGFSDKFLSGEFS